MVNMSLDPRRVESALGLRVQGVYPVATNCPLCGASGKFEIRSPRSVTCKSCWFIGDYLTALATARKEPLDLAITGAIAQGLVSFRSDNDRTSYTVAEGFQARIRQFFRNAADDLRDHASVRTAWLLEQHQIAPSYHDIPELWPHVGVCARVEIEAALGPFGKEARPVLQWWGRHTAVVVPVWNQTSCIGTWLLTKEGVEYLPLVGGEPVGAGLALAASIGDRAVILVDDVVTALRAQVWARRQRAGLTFTVPVPFRHGAQDYRGQRVGYLPSQGRLDWLLSCLQTDSATVLDPDRLGDWAGITADTVAREVARAPSVYATVATALLEHDADTVRAALVTGQVSAELQAKICAGAVPADRAALHALFADAAPDPVVHWDGDIVTDTGSAWMTKGRRVTDAVLVFDEIRTGAGDSVVTGSVRYRGQFHPFRTGLDTLTTDTKRWLTDFVVKATASVPYIAPGWGPKLVALAQEFHQPAAIRGVTQWGWQDGVLVLPAFHVGAGTVTASPQGIPGPQIQYPLELNDAEAAGFESVEFCRVVLVLVANMLRTRAGMSGVGVVLTNEPHCIDRLAAVLGVEPCTDADTAVVFNAATSPLPLLLRAGAEKAFGVQGPKHLWISTDAETAALTALDPGLIRLRVGRIDFDALRGVFDLVAEVLARGEPDLSQPNGYRAVVQAISAKVALRCPRHRLGQAATDLDMGAGVDSEASRILEVVLRNVSLGRIQPRFLPQDQVQIFFDEVLAATAASKYELPPLKQLTKVLAAKAYIIGSDSASWTFTQTVWSFNTAAMSAMTD